jgi:hypothetical protein
MTCTITTPGILGKATGEIRNAGPFYVDNKWTQGMHVGASCKLYTSDEEQTAITMPFFVSEKEVSPANIIELIPSNVVVIWLQQEGKTGLMVDSTPGKSITVKFKEIKPVDIRYTENGNWEMDPLAEGDGNN